MPTNLSTRIWITIGLSTALAIGTFVRMPVAKAQAPYNSNLYSGLKWRMLGPFRGGRVDAVSGVPGRPNEFYFGAVNGGVWKTIDAGRIWFSVFDSQPVASIGECHDDSPGTHAFDDFGEPGRGAQPFGIPCPRNLRFLMVHQTGHDVA